jgi:hypothetical protein
LSHCFLIPSGAFSEIPSAAFSEIPSAARDPYPLDVLFIPYTHFP